VLRISLPFESERDEAIFASVPAAPAVFLLRSDDPQAEPYISKTANLRRRLVRLLAAPEERSKKLNLRSRAKTIQYTPTGSDFESGFLLYCLLQAYFPKTYAARLRLRPSILIKMHMENAYPRASITRRIGRLNAISNYYGPFASRAAAERFANDALDFFKMRRCVDDLNPDPAFPGCIYSEMKMCLAPCFKGCTDEEYAAEVQRVQVYFKSGGQSLLRELTDERENASANLAFEDAAAIHVRVEKLKPVVTQLPEIVRRLDQISALMIQPSQITESVAFFRIDAGRIAGPCTFNIQPLEHAKSQSMETRVETTLQNLPPSTAKSALEFMEHLAILKRWYYRGARTGEIFFIDSKGELPMRRVVRGISRVFRGEKPEAEIAPPTP